MNWTCPYCNRDTTIVSSNCITNVSNLHINNVNGHKQLEIVWIVCPNKDCNQFALYSSLFDATFTNNGVSRAKLISQWNMVPQSNALVFPDYIPKAIIDDYQEACSIKNLSPKASATLSRRCLQGMIRDFYKVKKNNLFEEIDAIKEKIDPITWKSIDAVRKIGNIGAHMEKDIDLIIDVEPEEAQILTKLIEILIKDWYITKHEREATFEKVASIGKEKQDLKNK